MFLLLGGSNERSWNEAQSSCNVFGADLVDFQSESEMNAVYTHLDWNHNSGSWRFYWVGLNDLRQPNQLEWVNTASRNKPYNERSFKYWSIDGDMYVESRRCTFALFSNNLPDAANGDEGRWAKHSCSERNSYICKIAETDVVKECDSGWTVLDFGNGEK